MARPASCSPLVILILFFLIIPVAADGSGLPAGSSTPDQAASPPAYEIRLFAPTANLIHSDQILDQINELNGMDTLFATSFGLSRYNGSWMTLHTDLDNVSAGLMDDYVTAAEYDANGNLWLGYSGGIQIYNGRDYQTIRDQQLLKNLRINDLQRWDNDMWVATGNAGIHRYHAGTWTWYQPMTPEGPGFYEIDSMVLDPFANALVIATRNEGLWIISSPSDPIRFGQLAGKKSMYGGLKHVRRDPMGGVYFFDRSSVVHYGKETSFVPVLTNKDLSALEITINDISAGPDRNLYIATDDGMYIWREGAVQRHLTRFEGLGSSQAVRTVWVDTLNRVWFSSEGYVGYYVDLQNTGESIDIVIVTPSPVQSLVQPSLQNISPVTTTPAAGPGNGNSSIFDPIKDLVNALSGLVGTKIIP